MLVLQCLSGNEHRKWFFKEVILTTRCHNFSLIQVQSNFHAKTKPHTLEKSIIHVLLVHSNYKIIVSKKKKKKNLKLGFSLISKLGNKHIRLNKQTSNQRCIGPTMGPLIMPKDSFDCHNWEGGATGIQ